MSPEGDFVRNKKEKRAKAPSPDKYTLQRGKKDPNLAAPTQLGRAILSPEGDSVTGGRFGQGKGRKASNYARPAQKHPPRTKTPSSPK